MKLIDVNVIGNVLVLYFGKNNLKTYHGDDWDDSPCECNAGIVYDRYVYKIVEVAFTSDISVQSFYEHDYDSYFLAKNDIKAQKSAIVYLIDYSKSLDLPINMEESEKSILEKIEKIGGVILKTCRKR